MPIQHETIDHAYSIHRYTTDTVDIYHRPNQCVITCVHGFIMTPHQLIDPWPATQNPMPTPDMMSPICDLKPDIILLGLNTWAYPVDLMDYCHHRGASLEVMTRPSACRTFNLLANEYRSVALALPGQR